MSRKAVFWAVMVTALAAGTYCLIALDIANRDDAPPGSSYGRRRAGCKAAFLFLRESGVNASRRRVSWRTRLPERGMLVVAEPRYRPSSAERSALRHWVARGGTAFILAAEPWEIWPVGGKRVFGSSLVTAFRPLVPGAWTAGISSLHLAATWRLKPPFTSPPVILAGDKYGAALLLVPRGKGRVMLAADRDFLSNGRLASAADNGLFLLNLARSFGLTTVQFDEYHLGYGYQAESPETLARLPMTLRAVYWQLLFLFALYACTAGRRFGRPVALPRTGGRTITEYISSVATLYQRARAANVALDHLYRGLLERMRLLTGLSASADLELLAKAAAARIGTDPRSLQTFLVRCQTALGQERIAPTDLFTLARRIDLYRKELEKWVTLPR